MMFSIVIFKSWYEMKDVFVVQLL